MNVILITLDACRIDHLSFFGYGRKTSPNMDSISSEGALFLNNYAAIPQSDPAIVSILTGLYPHNNGIRTFGKSKSLRVSTLHQILKEKGYKTACISIEQKDNDSIKPGFDEFNLLEWRIKSKLLRLLKKFFNWKSNPGASEIVTDNAISWIKKNKDRNFFLYMHYMELHWPYSPPIPYDNIFDPDYNGKHTFNDLDGGKIKRGDLLFNNYQLPEEEIRHSIAHYDGAILYMDLQIGRLVKFLKSQGLWDRSIVIFVGDHGEHLGEHGFYYQHASSLYQPSLRVPLLIKVPNTNQIKIDALTQNIDIMPTILDMLKIPLSQPIDGKSLLPLMNNQTDKIRDYSFAESGVSLFKQNRRKYIEGIEGKWRMVTDGKWKLIYIPNPKNEIYELYNVEEDYYEKNNLINQETTIGASLKEKLHNWIEKKDVGDIETTENDPYSGKGEAKVRKRLRRLGYID